MPKIDTGRIDGYEGMTLEEKLSALEGYEYDDHSEDVERYKNAVSKANSEAASWKKKYNEQQTGDDKTKAEVATLREQLETLQREKTVASYKAQFATQGYDEQLAGETAEALASGDMATVFANNKRFLETHDKALIAGQMKDISKPAAGDPVDVVMTKKKFMELSTTEQQEYIKDHPDWQKTLK